MNQMDAYIAQEEEELADEQTSGKWASKPLQEGFN
jgi:hypothetical protein